MYWPTCRALSGLSVTYSIRFFWGGWVDICPTMFHDVVEECVCIFDHKVFAQRSRTLPVAKYWTFLRLRGWPGHGVCPLPHSLRRCPTVSTSYIYTLYGNINGILERRVGGSSGQDVVEILLQQFPCWIC